MTCNDELLPAAQRPHGRDTDSRSYCVMSYNNPTHSPATRVAAGTPTLPLHKNTGTDAFPLIFPLARMPAVCATVVDNAAVCTLVILQSSIDIGP